MYTTIYSVTFQQASTSISLENGVEPGEMVTRVCWYQTRTETPRHAELRAQHGGVTYKGGKLQADAQGEAVVIGGKVIAK